MQINKQELHDQLILSSQQGEWTKPLIVMMTAIAKGVAYHRVFRYVPDKQDMVQDGLMHLLEIWGKFDPTHPSANPFGYFTQALFRHYAKYFTKEVERNKVIVSLDEWDE